MSGTNNHCRIGKVTPKKPVLLEGPKRAKGRVRSMLMEMVKAVDINTQKGKAPLCGFVVIVNEDGSMEMGNRFNKKPNPNNSYSETDRLNWRHMAMAFEDMARDCRNFTLYGQPTTYDLVNEIPEEKGE